uniref:tRNA-uridine aminocarboxypropyltransferase 1 n=1 Tax=Guillardia theta TaxID=55529 RepID=A0A7S4PAY4_GUITH
MLFPSKDAVEASEMRWEGIKRVFVIDSTWLTTNQILRDERFRGMPHVKIAAEQTTFWRYHAHGEAFLSTAECIFHLLRQYSIATAGGYDGRYDQLLFYYAHFYRQIQLHYLHRSDRSFVHKNNYIHYDKASEEEAKLKALRKEEGIAEDEQAGMGNEQDEDEEGEVAKRASDARNQALLARERFFSPSSIPTEFAIAEVIKVREKWRALVTFRVDKPNWPSTKFACQIRYKGNAQKQQPPLQLDAATGEWRTYSQDLHDDEKTREMSGHHFGGHLGKINEEDLPQMIQVRFRSEPLGWSEWSSSIELERNHLQE